MSAEDIYRDWDAAYVLGALGPAERREFERHLAGCEACRAAVAELAGMPAVLSELDRAQALALVSPRSPDGGGPGGADVVPISSLASAAVRRQRRRWAWQAAAAVALVAAGGVGGVALSGPDGGARAAGVTAVTLDPVGGSDVSADLTLTPSTWGTSMEWSCSYPSLPGGPGPMDAVYELVLIDEDGTRTVAATWSADGDDHASGLLASSALGMEDIARVELAVEGADLVLAAADLDET